MYAKITKDHIDTTDILGPEFQREGWVVIDQPSPPHEHETERLEVRLLDDDRILYYEAIATDDALEPLFFWAQKDAGVTILQTNESGEWEDVIS